MIDLRQTPHYARYMQSIGWVVDHRSGVCIYIKKFPLFGSIAKIQRPHKLLTRTDLVNLKSKHNARIFYLEPFDEQVKHYQELGFKQYRHPFLPSKTIQIDLTKPQGFILKQMHQKTRYNIKVSQKRDVKIINSVDVNLFANFWQKQARDRRSFIPEKKFIVGMFHAFGDKSNIFLALRDERIIAGLMTLQTSEAICYMYAASDDTGRKLFAPTLLVWEAIKFGKSQNLKTFDFEGIYDERFPLPAWKGFTRFKKGFGGKILVFPGVYRKMSLA